MNISSEKIIIGLIGIALVFSAFGLFTPNAPQNKYVNPNDIYGNITTQWQENQPNIVNTFVIIWTGLIGTITLIGNTLFNAVPSLLSDVFSLIGVPSSISIIIITIIVAPLIIYLLKVIRGR